MVSNNFFIPRLWHGKHQKKSLVKDQAIIYKVIRDCGHLVHEHAHAQALQQLRLLPLQLLRQS